MHCPIARTLPPHVAWAGNDTVAVIADPTIADNVKELADGYNASAGPIGDRCVSVTVKPAGSDAVISGFIGKWPGELGNQAGVVDPRELDLRGAAFGGPRARKPSATAVRW